MLYDKVYLLITSQSLVKTIEIFDITYKYQTTYFISMICLLIEQGKPTHFKISCNHSVGLAISLENGSNDPKVVRDQKAGI